MDSPLPATLEQDWVDFLANPRNSNPEPYAANHAVFQHPVLFPLQREAELNQMLAMAAKANVVMEIGSDKGAGIYHLAFALPSVVKAIAVEVRGVPYADVFQEHLPDTEFYGFGMSSYDLETLGMVERALNGDLIDVLFLDGDKAMYEADFNLYRKFMRPGGIVFLHDVQDDIPPRRVFHKLQAQYKTSVILDVSEGEAALTRKAMGEPPRSAHEGWLYHWGTTSCGVGVVRIP